MPGIVAPRIINYEIAHIIQDPRFGTLSPDAQAALLAASRSNKPANAGDKRLAAALTESRDVGILGDDELRNGLMMLGIMGGAAAAGTLSGGGAAAAPTAGASGGVGIGETGAVTGLGGSGFGGAAVGGTAAASGGSTAGSIGSTVAKTGGFGWKDILPTLIGAGTSIGGAAIGAHGQTEAAKIQAESADKALAYQKEMFERQQADLAPYREVGQSSMRQLAFGTGLPVPDMPAKQPAPAPAMPSPGAVPRQPTQMVSVQSPSGQVGQIPASQLQAAIQAGGKQVQ